MACLVRNEFWGDGRRKTGHSSTGSPGTPASHPSNATQGPEKKKKKQSYDKEGALIRVVAIPPDNILVICVRHCRPRAQDEGETGRACPRE